MKIGISESPYRRYGSERFRVIREHGYEAVDYAMANTDQEPYTVSDEEFERILLEDKRLAEEAGIEIYQVHGPWRWPTQDATEEDRAERMEKMKKSIRGTALLGCRHWVIHPIMPFTYIDTGHEAETREMNLIFMRELLETAKEYDVVICLENMPMPKLGLGSPNATLDFIKEINDDHFKMCLDTGHAAFFREESAADFVRKNADYILSFHIHDNNGYADLHLMPYYGVIDWEDFGKALREVGFSGSFSLETAPSRKLPSEQFDKMSKLLFEIAKSIIE